MVVGVLLAFLLGWVLGKLSEKLSNAVAQFQTVIDPSLPYLWGFVSWSVVGLLVSLAIVLIAGLLRLLVFQDRGEK